jgi:hypothetical protein
VAPDGTVYVATSNATLLGYDQSGAQKSSRPLPFNNATALAVGDDGRIYVKSDESLLVFDAQGEKLWSCTTQAGGGIALGQNGVTYISAGSYLNACDSQGVALWSHSLGSFWDASTPVVGTGGTVYIMNSGSLLAVDSFGVVRWTLDMDYAGGNPLALGPGGTIFVTCYSISAVAPDGHVRWAFAPDGYHYSWHGPAVGPEGAVYFSIGDTLHAVNSDGTRHWSAYLGGYGTHMVPVISDDGRVYVAGSYPSLAAFDADGKPLWRVNGYGESSGHPLLVDSTLLVADTYNGLTAYRVSGTGPAQGWPMFQHDARRSGRTE